jgi:hypothetical protein
MNWLKIWAISSLCVLCFSFLGAWYVPYYTRRWQTYLTHEQILNEQCYNDTRMHPKIKYKVLELNDVETNCQHSLAYTTVPIFLGAISDLWKETPFYALLYGTSWTITLSLIGGFFLFIYLCSAQIFNFIFKNRVITNQIPLNRFIYPKPVPAPVKEKVKEKPKFILGVNHPTVA